MNSNWVTGVLIAVVAVIGVYTFTGGGSSGPQGPQGPQGFQGPQGEQGIAGNDGANGRNGVNGVSTPAPSPAPRFGASGPVGNELVQFLAGFVISDNYATTTPASATLSAREAAGFSTVSFYPNVGDVTLTLPASTTLGSLLGPIAGSMKRVCYYNATTTNGIDITFASGTGVDLEVASTTGLFIIADGTACIEFQKKSGTGGNNRNDITARLVRFGDGD